MAVAGQNLGWTDNSNSPQSVILWTFSALTAHIPLLVYCHHTITLVYIALFNSFAWQLQMCELAPVNLQGASCDPTLIAVEADIYFTGPSQIYYEDLL